MPDYSQFAPYATVIPREFPTEGQALMQQNQQRYEMMLRERAEQRYNEKEMLDYMNSVLDPNKHHGPGAMLSGVIQDNLSGLFDKYTTSLKDHKYYDPKDFENDLRNDMGNLVNVEKRANSNFDAQMKSFDDMKTLRPDLDIAKARQEMETRVGMGYLVKDKNGKFGLNPSPDVPYVDMASQLSDPLFAAGYSNDKTSLVDILRKVPDGDKLQYGVKQPNGTDRGGYNLQEAKPKYWQELGFKPKGFFTEGGVLPTLKTSGEQRDINGQPVMLATEDHYNTIKGNDVTMTKLYKELASDTGMTYEQLADMRNHDPDQFETLTRAKLYHGFEAAGNKFGSAGYNEPPAPTHYSTTTNINTAPEVNNVYEEIRGKAAKTDNGLLPFNELSPIAQKEVLGYANTSNKSSKTDNLGSPLPLDQRDVAVWANEQGQMFLVKADPDTKKVNSKNGVPTDIIMPIDFTSANWGVQAGAKAKGQVVKDAKKPNQKGVLD